MNPYVVAAWDVSRLRGAAGALVDIAEGARSWVTRGDAVRQALAAPQAWTGEASIAARADLEGWLAVTARAGPPLLALAEGVYDAVVWYQQAQEAAATALRTAAMNGVAISATGEVTPGPQVDTSAMAPEQAAVAAARATAAGLVLAELERSRDAAARADALARSDIGQFLALGIPGFDAWSGYVDLVLGLRAGAPIVGDPVTVPIGDVPEAVARWWARLSFDQQLRLIHDSPQLLGGLDGVPAWARDLANRAVLDDLLAVDPADPFALAAAAALARAEATGGPVQLYLLDPVQQRAAVAVGDLDAAESVAVLVPGMLTTVPADLSEFVGDAITLQAATAVWDPTAAVAVLAWIGYDAPGLAQAPFPYHAEWGAPALAGAVAGIAARPGEPRVTVVAHSYGTVLTARAAEQPGELGADAVVLLGSPGVPIPAAEFEVPEGELYVGEAPFDLVADIEWHGVDPGDGWLFDATCIEAGNQALLHNGHTGYYDETSDALWNVAAIMLGHRARVARC